MGKSSRGVAHLAGLSTSAPAEFGSHSTCHPERMLSLSHRTNKFMGSWTELSSDDDRRLVRLRRGEACACGCLSAGGLARKMISGILTCF